MKKEIIGLIPVKGSSERVKDKNLRPFHDTSLYELKLNQLKGVKGFSDIIVSSENELVLDIAKKKGFHVHVRDPKYSTSDIPMSEVYSFVASEIPGEHIAWINVTNPLAETEIYEHAINEYNAMGEEHDCLLSAYEVKDYIFHNGKPVNFKSKPWPKSQDLTGLCAIPFVINIMKRDDMIKWESCVGNNPHFFLIDRVTAMDVDYQEDFDFCEMIFKQRCKNPNQGVSG